MANYILMSLTGGKFRPIASDEELRGLADELGFHGEELADAAIRDVDPTEYILLAEEDFPVAATRSGADFYDIIASWCVNTAFGRMDDYDAYSTIRDTAEELDRFGNKGNEFRHAAEIDFWKGKAQELDESDPFGVYYGEMPDEIDPENEDAVDNWVQAQERDNFEDWYREQKMPFDTMSKDEVLEVVLDTVYNPKDVRSWWK